MEGAAKHSIEVKQRTDVVWTAMLYGSGEGVMRHLQQCLILGYVLRYQLKPWLAAQGITMQNILLITETSLAESDFRAASFMWSIMFKDLPKVHDSRLDATSHHLIGEKAHPAHVFLKSEAFNIESRLSIVSDWTLL